MNNLINTQSKKITLIFLITVMVCSLSQGQVRLLEKVERKSNEIVIPYEKYVLDNGLTLIIHEDRSDPVVHVDVTYHVGSAREEIGKSGFAHFFEHMMFQGSDHVGDEQHLKIVQDAGGVINGTTNRDRTNYYQTVPNNQLEKILWLEADRMGFFLDAVTQKKFEIQRATVKNEKGQNFENVPYIGGFETLNKSIYPYGHPYSWLTIGYVQDLNRVNVEDLKNFFLRWYGPNNATLSIGGDVDTKEVIKLVQKYFGSIPKGPEVQNMKLDLVTLKENRYISYIDNYAKLPLLYMVYPTIPNYHPDMGPLACLAQILGQGKNSVLYQQLTKKQLALQALASSSLFELAGEFNIQVLPMPGKSLSDLERYYRQALDTFEMKGISDEDIERFKGGIESSLINDLQSVNGKVSKLAAFQTFTGNPNKMSELLKIYTSFEKADVMRVYNQYIKNKGAVILSIVPKGQEPLVANVNNYKVDSSVYNAPDYGYTGLKYNKAKDNFDRSKQPGTGANPTVKVPKFWRKDLDNGIKAIGAENNELPTVTFTLMIPGGHLAQANDMSKAGLASFFTDMMAEDTKNFTAEQIAVQLQKLGSSISIYTELDVVTYSVQSLKKNLDQTLKILEERLFNPKFTEQSFNRIKGQTLESFKVTMSQPSAVADAVFAKMNYGANHILGISQEGNEETVKNISLKDIEDYYKNYMTSVNSKIIVVGNIEEKELLSKLGFLDRLPKKKIDLPAIPAPLKVDKTKVYLVDVPAGTQTEFRMGYATGLKYDPTGEYFKANLANYSLGGNFNSRLNLMLREDKGWTYGAHSSFSGDEYSGTFKFESGIKQDATDSALSVIMKEIKTFTAQGIQDDELAYLKNSIGQRDALRFETGSQKAQFIGRILDYNLPANYVEQQSKLLKNITKEEVNKSAKKHIQADKMNILLVGDKAKIMEKVKNQGYEVVELDAKGNKIDKKVF